MRGPARPLSADDLRILAESLDAIPEPILGSGPQVYTAGLEWPGEYDLPERNDFISAAFDPSLDQWVVFIETNAAENF